jgi:perosamine synthetase
MKIPFHRPNLPESLDDIYRDSIRSGWLTTGSQVQEFESKLAQYLDAEYVVAVNSCTAALHLALAAKDFSKGKKFIVPTYTFVSTVECGEYLGMEPILVDCVKDGFLMDLNQVEDILKKESRVKAILPVHYGGEPADMKHLFDLAQRFGVFILEDAAHALETVSSSGKVGNTDYAAAFSFYANKNMTTGGEGGALTTNDPKLAEKVKKLSLHGISKDGWDRFKSHGDWEYDINELGFKYNLSDLAASFGLWQMEQLEDWKKRRFDIVKKYIQGLGSIDGLILPDIKNGHAWHLFVIQLKIEHLHISRNEFIEKMNQNGIGLAVHYKPIHALSYYRENYDLKPNQFPRANSLFNSVITLPLYPRLTDSDVDYIINSIQEFSEKYSK